MSDIKTLYCVYMKLFQKTSLYNWTDMKSSPWAEDLTKH